MSVLCRIFGHSWETTVYNAYAVSIEQKCRRCNTMRWHGVEHAFPIDKPIRWQHGKHPNVIRAGAEYSV